MNGRYREKQTKNHKIQYFQFLKLKIAKYNSYRLIAKNKMWKIVYNALFEVQKNLRMRRKNFVVPKI